MQNRASERAGRCTIWRRTIPHDREESSLTLSEMLAWFSLWELADGKPGTVKTTPTRSATSYQRGRQSGIDALNGLLAKGFIEIADRSWTRRSARTWPLDVVHLGAG